MRGVTRALVAVTALAVVGAAAGCSALRPNDPPKPKSPAAPLSAYELVLEQIKPDGTVDKDTALAAFSLAIAPLPGVAVPDGPKQSIQSGTAAISWTMQHWGELDPAQREAVTEALTGARDPVRTSSFTGSGPVPGQAPSPTARPNQSAKPKAADPNLACATADSADAGQLRPALDASIAAIAAKLGHTMRTPVRLVVNTKQLEDDPEGTRPTLMYTWPCKGAAVAEGRQDGCTLHVNPHAFDPLYSNADREAFLTHEAMHCFLLDKFGRAHDDAPAWLMEGIPTWVQVALHGGDPAATRIWERYLALDRKPLFQRAYDAVGFFAQLANSGVDPWPLLEPTFAAYLSGGNAAAWRKTGAGEPLLRSWAAGYARATRSGADWDIVGYGIPRSDPQVRDAGRLAAGGSVEASAPAAGIDLVRLTLPDDSVLTVTGDPSARGLLGIANTDQEINNLVGTQLCTRPGGCACPEGGAGAGAQLPGMLAGSGYLAVTGGLTAAKVQIAVTSLDDFCAKPAAQAACLAGKWTHTGVDLRYTSPEFQMTETGGAGFVFTIAADGKANLTFDPMQPVTFRTSTGLAGSITYRGGVDYQLSLPPGAGSGEVNLTGADFSRLRATARITQPFVATVVDNEPLSALVSGVGGAGGAGAGGALGNQPLSGPHRFTCSADRLVLSLPPGSALTGSWTFSRG